MADVRDRPQCPPTALGRAIRELPATERPRERLALRGVGGLTAAELIGLVWGSGTHGRRRSILPRTRWPATTG